MLQTVLKAVSKTSKKVTDYRSMRTGAPKLQYDLVWNRIKLFNGLKCFWLSFPLTLSLDSLVFPRFPPDFPRCSLSFPSISPRCFQGFPQVFPRFPLDFPQVIPRLPQVFLRFSPEFPRVSPRFPPGFPQGSPGFPQELWERLKEKTMDFISLFTPFWLHFGSILTPF